ncbi:MAG: hypothetical protein KDA53_08935 [Hyphomonas sp.]|nr:hypothetical protein [Hyphomonas sp.]
MQTLLRALFTPQVRSGAKPAVLFALAFAAVAAPLSLALRAAAPMPDLVVLSPKLAAYEAAPERYDTVFVGTSRTFYHIVPDEVERGAAEAGCTGWNVMNFGVFGLTGAEEDWLVERIVTAGEGHLQRIVIEDPLMNARDFADATTDRARFFSGPDSWQAQADNISSFPESLPKRLYRSGILGLGIGFDLSGVGRGAALAFPSGKPDEPFTFEMRQDGFEALGSLMTPDIAARRQEFEDHPERFEEMLARYGAPSSEDITARATYLAERLDALSARGLTAALYVSPDLAELDRTPRTGEAVRNLPGERIVMNFNRPDVHPDFFTPDLWFDFSHLGEAGARRLSFEAGRDFCARSTAESTSQEFSANAVR